MSAALCQKELGGENKDSWWFFYVKNLLTRNERVQNGKVAKNIFWTGAGGPHLIGNFGRFGDTQPLQSSLWGEDLQPPSRKYFSLLYHSSVRIGSKNSQENTDPNCTDPGFFKFDRDPIPNQEIWFVNRIGDRGSRTSASLAVCMVLNKMNNCSNLHYWGESPTTFLSYLFLKAVKEYVVRKYEHSSFYSEHMLQIPIGNVL